MGWIILLLVILLLLAYVLEGRAWLKSKPWAQPFFAWIEPIEIALFKKSETMLLARVLWVGGFVVAAYDSLAVFFVALDWTPLTNRLLYWIPEDLRGLVFSGAIGALGLLIGWLRKRTTKPIEIVELPEQNMPVEVAIAVERAESAKRVAVTAVEQAKVQEKI